jgi:hypothetical protein
MSGLSTEGEAREPAKSMEIIRLNAEESLKMVEAILNPREPNARLCAAAKRYMEGRRGEVTEGKSDRTRPLHHRAR